MIRLIRQIAIVAMIIFAAPLCVMAQETTAPTLPSGTVAPETSSTPPTLSTDVPLEPTSFANQRAMEPVASNAAMPHDLSPIGMFMAADKVVKTIMIILVLASILTWIILIVKTIEIMSAKKKAKNVLKLVFEAQNLSNLSSAIKNEKTISAALVNATEKEVHASLSIIDEAGGEGLKERISSILARMVLGAGRNISVGTGVLATIGAISPFVGLFGTVWGIMNSFIGISQAQTTNLAVVAPGIAEALLATALGLVAAIPAVVIYNIFARSITNYRQQLVDVSAGIERLVSRDLDFRKSQQKTSQRTNFSNAAE